MEWVLLQIKDSTTFLSPPPPPPPPPPPLSLSSPSHSSGFDLNNKVSPSMLLIIIILAIIFFVSGLLHLLVRFLLRPPNRERDVMDDVTALQGQLQQLFHLHDAGVDQTFIDSLPVFNYKAIIGVKKDPFDCAVCLCEFEADDNLRLLPKCSHAFHMDCIDTWLLSHSTCPLCRASLLSDFSPNGHCSPIVLVLESGSESSREIVSDHSVVGVNSHLSARFDDVFKGDPSLKSGEIVQEKEEEEVDREKVVEKVVLVKLGKFKNVDGGGEGGTGESNADARRCFSMGSFAYVMDEDLSLQVPIRTPSTMKKESIKKKRCLPLAPGHRAAMSECGCNSMREFNGFEAFKILDIQSDGGDDKKSISGSGSKRESFSVSKIWLRGKKDKAVTDESSRRAFSFRFPMGSDDESKSGKNGRRSENGWSEVSVDEEIGRCNSFDFSQANPTSYGKGTLFWLMGKQNKIVHSSFLSNV